MQRTLKRFGVLIQDAGDAQVVRGLGVDLVVVDEDGFIICQVAGLV